MENVKDEAFSKVKDFKARTVEKVKTAGKDAVDFVVRNKEVIMVTVPLGVAALKTGQSFIVSHRGKQERNRIDRTYYDPSTGFHWELRRKATNADRAEILKRKKQGEDMYNILKNLNLIR